MYGATSYAHILVLSSIYVISDSPGYGVGYSGIFSNTGTWNSSELSNIPIFWYALYVLYDSLVGAIIFAIYWYAYSATAFPYGLFTSNFWKYVVSCPHLIQLFLNISVPPFIADTGSFHPFPAAYVKPLVIAFGGVAPILK